MSDGKLYKYGQFTSNKKLSNYIRAIDISNKLGELVYNKRPDVITIEGLPFMSRSNVTRDLAGLQYLIVDRMVDLGYKLDENLFIIPPTQLKKFATGSGKAGKDDMVDAIPSPLKATIKRIPVKDGRRDIADAYWLAKHGEQCEHINI